MVDHMADATRTSLLESDFALENPVETFTMPYDKAL